MGTKDWLSHAGFVVLVLVVARHHLSTMPSVPTGVKLRHYLFLAFLTLMNFAGIGHAAWTTRRLLGGGLVEGLAEYFIALRTLSPYLAVPIWIYCVVGRCMTLLIVAGIARARTQNRKRLLRYFPLLVIAEALSFCISFRGGRVLDDRLSEATQNLIALCAWGVLTGWLYIWAYCFYRGRVSDVLFLSVDADSPDNTGNESS